MAFQKFGATGSPSLKNLDDNFSHMKFGSRNVLNLSARAAASRQNQIGTPWAWNVNSDISPTTPLIFTGAGGKGA